MPGKVGVKIKAGRNLPIMDKSSETTDAYVEIKLGNVTHKTDVCRKSLNPQWNTDWFRFEVDDAELQDEPLQIRVMDHDTYSANDAIGKVNISLNPLCLETGQGKSAILSGWIPVFDTMHGVRGEVNVIVKVDLFSDLNKFRQSSCGVRFFHSPCIPHGYRAQVIHGFVEELVVNDDPEYQWIDKIRTPRASNEARQVVFLRLSGQVQRKIGLKATNLGANAVVGYRQCFDLEGDVGVVARGIGTAVTLVRIQEPSKENLADNTVIEEQTLKYLEFLTRANDPCNNYFTTVEMVASENKSDDSVSETSNMRSLLRQEEQRDEKPRKKFKHHVKRIKNQSYMMINKKCGALKKKLRDADKSDNETKSLSSSLSTVSVIEPFRSSLMDLRNAVGLGKSKSSRHQIMRSISDATGMAAAASQKPPLTFEANMHETIHSSPSIITPEKHRKTMNTRDTSLSSESTSNEGVRPVQGTRDDADSITIITEESGEVSSTNELQNARDRKLSNAVNKQELDMILKTFALKDGFINDMNVNMSSSSASLSTSDGEDDNDDDEDSADDEADEMNWMQPGTSVDDLEYEEERRGSLLHDLRDNIAIKYHQLQERIHRSTRSPDKQKSKDQTTSITNRPGDPNEQSTSQPPKIIIIESVDDRMERLSPEPVIPTTVIDLLRQQTDHQPSHPNFNKATVEMKLSQSAPTTIQQLKDKQDKSYDYYSSEPEQSPDDNTLNVITARPSPVALNNAPHYSASNKLSNRSAVASPTKIRTKFTSPILQICPPTPTLTESESSPAETLSPVKLYPNPKVPSSSYLSVNTLKKSNSDLSLSNKPINHSQSLVTLSNHTNNASLLAPSTPLRIKHHRSSTDLASSTASGIAADATTILASSPPTKPTAPLSATATAGATTHVRTDSSASKTSPSPSKIIASGGSISSTSAAATVSATMPIASAGKDIEICRRSSDSDLSITPKGILKTPKKTYTILRLNKKPFRSNKVSPTSSHTSPKEFEKSAKKKDASPQQHVSFSLETKKSPTKQKQALEPQSGISSSISPTALKKESCRKLRDLLSKDSKKASKKKDLSPKALTSSLCDEPIKERLKAKPVPSTSNSSLVKSSDLSEVPIKIELDSEPVPSTPRKSVVKLAVTKEPIKVEQDSKPVTSTLRSSIVKSTILSKEPITEKLDSEPVPSTSSKSLAESAISSKETIKEGSEPVPSISTKSLAKSAIPSKETIKECSESVPSTSSSSMVKSTVLFKEPIKVELDSEPVPSTSSKSFAKSVIPSKEKIKKGSEPVPSTSSSSMVTLSLPREIDDTSQKETETRQQSPEKGTNTQLRLSSPERSKKSPRKKVLSPWKFAFSDEPIKEESETEPMPSTSQAFRKDFLNIELTEGLMKSSPRKKQEHSSEEIKAKDKGICPQLHISFSDDCNPEPKGSEQRERKEGNSICVPSDRLMQATAQMRHNTAITLKNNPDSLDMLEYPFLTLTKYPPGFILQLGPTCSSRSVKLLERVPNPDEPETRDSWWTEIRMEVRSHARAACCNVVLGYTETTTICDDVCVLTAFGTGAVINVMYNRTALHLELPIAKAGNMTTSLDDHDITRDLKDVSIASTVAMSNSFNGPQKPSTGNQQPPNSKYDCTMCHVPYNRSTVPFPVKTRKCAICRKGRVPDIFLTTIEIPDSLQMTGRGCLIQATIVRPKKDLRSESNAKEISDGLPFLEYELHRVLINKLKSKGMNSIFGFKAKVSIGDRMITLVATGTAVYITALPQPDVPKIVGTPWTDRTKLTEVQRALQETFERNREIYQLKSMDPDFEPIDRQSDTDESDDEAVEIDWNAGHKDACLLEVDDIEDVEIISQLTEPIPPKGFHVVNTQSVPGLQDMEIVRNLQFFTQVWRAKAGPNLTSKILGAHFNRLCQTIYFKLRSMAPCAICDLKFLLDLPEGDEIQLLITGMALGLGEVNKFKNRRKTVNDVSASAKNAQDEEFIFTLDEDQLMESSPPTGPSTSAAAAAAATGYGNFSLKHKRGSPMGSKLSTGSRSLKPFPLRERYGVDITPLTYVPGGKIEKYLGNLNFFFIRESTSLRELGGISGFVHSFITELLAVVRAHITVLGGNAMVAFYMTELILDDNQHKGQAQCLVSVGGDVVYVSYHPDD